MEFALGEALLLFRPDPAWMVRTAAAGCWPYGLGMHPAKGKPALRRDKGGLDTGEAGWDRYGMVRQVLELRPAPLNEESMYIPGCSGATAPTSTGMSPARCGARRCRLPLGRPGPAVFYLMLMG